MKQAEQIRRLELNITPGLAGVRVDTLLRKHLLLSGTVIRRIKWLEDGILVDGVRVNTRFVPRAGQVLSVRLSDPERLSGVVPSPGKLDIVYEDEDIIVLNKAPGLSVHPGPGHFDDTLGNFLVHYYEKTNQPADFHPVHRLDRGTSGLLVVAKHPHAQERLKEQLHSPDFCRVYLAVCEGVPQPETGVVDAPLGPVDGSLMAQQVCPDGKPARTRYETVRTTGIRTLLCLELETGRTHQIRVHMAHIGHPLTGDFLYGTEDTSLITRTALHSHQLSFRHPVTGRSLHFVQPLPGDMEQLVPQGFSV
ncbi:MAG: RluA family pseudouridine synthase [Ruminococcaceae bacterium]|nr:RluA family pseudouridine synthase [Oscillospiraceae bacterium]